MNYGVKDAIIILGKTEYGGLTKCYCVIVSPLFSQLFVVLPKHIAEDAMARRHLIDRISKAYTYMDPTVEIIKSAFMGLCTDIDRYFSICFSLDLEEKANEEQFQTVKTFHPILTDLSLDKFHLTQNLFCQIRNLSAHLFLNKPILLDNCIKEYMFSKALPYYSISDNGELTLYGAFYCLTFLSQKSALWPFITAFFRSDLFVDINNKETNSIQTSLEHYHQTFCGIGKPAFPNKSSSMSSTECLYINDTCKRSLTKIFFSIEKSVLMWTVSKRWCPHFSDLLNKEPQFSTNQGLINDTIVMRNCWFHGRMLFDSITFKGKPFVFSLDFLLSTLSKIKNQLRDPRFSQTKNDIETFGKAFIDFYLLRLIEISYKLLDRRLLTKEKTDSRINDANKALERIKNQDKGYYEKLKNLIDPGILQYSVKAPKFTDLIPRDTKARPLVLHSIESKNGFTIGDYKTDSNMLSLAEVDIDYQYMNTINGFLLPDLKSTYEEKYSDIFKVVYHTI